MKKTNIKKYTESSKAIILFQYCSKEWYPLIEHFLEIKKAQKGEFIFREGEKVKRMKFIKSGKVKVISEEQGQQKIIRFSGEGDILGHRGLGSELIYPVSALTLTDVEIYSIPVDFFLKLVKANSQLSFWLINFLADELRRAEKQSKVLAHYNVKQRIVVSLLNIARSFGFSTDIPGLLSFTPSRQDVASMVGTTYESVIRMFAELEKEGVIKLSGKEIILTDVDKLSRYAQRMSLYF